MSLDMFEKMIRSDERSAAAGTHKLFLSSVSSLVTGQLVTAGKYLVTIRVGAVKWLFS